MEDSSDVPLFCPRCHEATARPVRWIQENTFFACAHCGATVLIDKDAATKALAQLQQSRAD
jgi:DNA-directed RNA polymerase subunit RPC12/RpoP